MCVSSHSHDKHRSQADGNMVARERVLSTCLRWCGDASLARGHLSGDLPQVQLHPPPSWPRSLLPVSDCHSTLCFTILLQAHWPSCCCSLPQNLSAFRSFCPESSSSRSSRGSGPHLTQVSAPVSAPGRRSPSTHTPLHRAPRSTGPAPRAPGTSQHGFTVCVSVLSHT